jgi:2-polyprenyl-3-methyl-5-hydroxy-6-metoxy-1,4-benzoquinol methylase
MSIEFYEQNAEDFFRRSVEADMLPQLTRFAGLLPTGARILDAGCGAGRDAKAFAAMGFDVTATEAAPRLAELARRHTGLDIRVMTFDEMDWRGAFDGIWACASLLHVPRANLPATLRRLRDALVPGGVLWMSFKHGDQERQVPGRIFTDLDESGSARLLSVAGGLELIEMEVTGDVRPDRAHERWLSLLCRRV